MQSAWGHFPRTDREFFNRGGTPYSYNTRDDLKETLFVTVNLSNCLSSEFCDCFLDGESLHHNDYFLPSFVNYS